MKRPMKISFLCALIFGMLLTAVYSGTETVEATGNNMVVHMVNVNGAGFIVELPNEEVMVVDAGVGADKQIFFDRLDALGITNINYLVGTHGHVDHIANFDDIINNYSVSKVVLPENNPALESSQYYIDLKAAADSQGIPIKRVNKGGNIFPDVHLGNGLTLSSHVNSPGSEVNYDNTSQPANNYSLVFNVKYGSRGIEFTGDIHPVVETDILNNHPPLDIQVLVAPHHGYNGSTSDDFLDYFKDNVDGYMRVLIPNVDNGTNVNNFKARLRTRNIRYWSTYANGNMDLTTDGTSWSANEAAEWQ